jgi:hypothetical protein
VQYLTGNGLKARNSEIAAHDVLLGEGPSNNATSFEPSGQYILVPGSKSSFQRLLGLVYFLIRTVNILQSSGSHLHVLLVPSFVRVTRNLSFSKRYINTCCNEIYN